MFLLHGGSRESGGTSHPLAVHLVSLGLTAGGHSGGGLAAIPGSLLAVLLVTAHGQLLLRSASRVMITPADR
jgi:hypothetical protein